MTILPKKKQPHKQQQQQPTNDEQHDSHHVDNYHGHVGHSSNVVVTQTNVVGTANQLSTNVGRLSQWTTSRNVVVNDCSVDKRPAPDNGHSVHGPQHSSKRRHRVQRNVINNNVERDQHHQRLIAAANIRTNQSSIGASNSTRTNDQDSMIAIPGCSNNIINNDNNDQHEQPQQQQQQSMNDFNVVVDDGDDEEEDFSGYNSGDEYQRNSNTNDSSSQIDWEEKERLFERMIRKKGFNIKKMSEDGACLFRAVADQVYGDQEMHSAVRKLCMDYMEKNGDYFSQYVTENFADYIRRKRCEHIHGNHIEIQAISEIFNRPVQVYHYSSEPINIENCQKTDNEPIRLSYHRNTHYNSIVNPYKATIGVGLGLPSFKPGLAEKSLVEKALFMSEQHELEQAMLEDKIRATDWEATTEAIEEQIARESYIEWLRENERRSRTKTTTTTKSSSATSTLTINNLADDESILNNNNNNINANSSSSSSTQQLSPRCYSPRCSSAAATTSSSSSNSMMMMMKNSTSPNHSQGSSPKRSKESMKQQQQSTNATLSNNNNNNTNNDSIEATSTFLHELPPSLLGLNDWDVSDPLLAQVLAQSQQEYLESLKQQTRNDTNHNNNANPKPSSSSSASNTTSVDNLISLPSTSSKYDDRSII